MINLLEAEWATEGNFWIPGSESALVEPPTTPGDPRLSFCHIGIGDQAYILMRLTKHSQIKLKNPGGAPSFELCTSTIFDWNFSVFCRTDCWMQAVSEQFTIALTMLHLVEGAVYGNTVPLKINPAIVVTICHHHRYHHCPTKIEMHNLIIFRPTSESLGNMCFESGAPPVEQTLRFIDPSHHRHLEEFRKRLFFLTWLSWHHHCMYPPVCIMSEEEQCTILFSSDLSVILLLRITSGSKICSHVDSFIGAVHNDSLPLKLSSSFSERNCCYDAQFGQNERMHLL